MQNYNIFGIFENDSQNFYIFDVAGIFLQLNDGSHQFSHALLIVGNVEGNFDSIYKRIGGQIEGQQLGGAGVIVTDVAIVQSP